MYFAWLCMFCRQPAASTSVSAITERTAVSDLNFGHLAGVQVGEELLRPLAIELGIGRLDDEEEVGARGLGEARHVENRVVGLGQAVEREHAEDGEERRDED